MYNTTSYLGHVFLLLILFLFCICFLYCTMIHVFFIIINFCHSFITHLRCVDFFILLIFVIVNSISHLSNLYLSRSIHIKKLPKTTNLSINFIWPLNIDISGLCVHIAKDRDHIYNMVTNIQRKQYNNQQRLIYNWSHIEED